MTEMPDELWEEVFANVENSIRMSIPQRNMHFESPEQIRDTLYAEYDHRLLSVISHKGYHLRLSDPTSPEFLKIGLRKTEFFNRLDEEFLR